MFVFPGFNSNVEHRNKNYHVQTEVNCVEGKNRINTLIYLSGRIYHSLSSTLAEEESLNRETSVAAIRRQHNKIIRDLISDQLEPQKNSTEKDSVDFLGIYERNELFSCNGKCFSNAHEAYKKLLLPEEDETTSSG